MNFTVIEQRMQCHIKGIVAAVRSLAERFYIIGAISFDIKKWLHFAMDCGRIDLFIGHAYEKL